MGFEIDDNKLKRAGLDYWHMLDITCYDDIAAFWNSVATGASCPEDGIPDTCGYDFYYFSTKARRIYTEPRYPDNAYVFFGSETKGLDEALLRKNMDQCVRFPMLTGARSLNLSNSVAVGVFEVLRQWGFPALQNHGELKEKI